jgi:hypothetical protein
VIEEGQKTLGGCVDAIEDFMVATLRGVTAPVLELVVEELELHHLEEGYASALS